MPDLTEGRTRPSRPVLADGAEVLAALRAAAGERILILDGAMGTQIQGLGFEEEHFRGDTLRGLRPPSEGQQRSSDPDPARRDRGDPLRLLPIAGADIIETNTFSSTSIAQADYGMEDAVHALNREGARLARGPPPGPSGGRPPPLRRRRAGPDQPHRLASRPTSTIPATAPSPSTICAIAYGEQTRGLIDGGADIILIETIFDTLNAKAAIFASRGSLRRKGRAPAGDDLRHHHRSLRPHPVRPDADGLLAFGAPCQAVHHRAQLRAGRQRHARASRRACRRSPTRSSAPIPMPACPMNSATMTRRPETMAAQIARLRRGRPGQYRRRLLRHDAGAYPRHRRGGRRDCRRAPSPTAAADAPVGAGAVHAAPTISTSSMSASAPTSPARPSSAS